MDKTVSLTIDVESDWGGRAKSSEGIRNCIPEILRLLDDFNIKTTFFLSGVTIGENREALWDIVDAGHEIASHGYLHEDHSKMSKDELSLEIAKSKDVINDEFGVEVVGFRAPQGRTNKYLFDVLAELNFKYDSSLIRSIIPGRYANLRVPSEPYQLKNGLLEIPISCLPYLRIPFGLLWINTIGFVGFKLFLNGVKLPNHITIFLHPFDLLQSKSRSREFGFFVNQWYNYKQQGVSKTLKSLTKYYIDKKRKFILLKEVVSF